MKIKIISWNMHDSIPGGDLEQLLGPIPPHIPSSFDLPPNDCNLPDLGDDDLHPYHLVVVYVAANLCLWRPHGSQFLQRRSGMPFAFWYSHGHWSWLQAGPSQG